jgi:hypothetical protein
VICSWPCPYLVNGIIHVLWKPSCRVAAGAGRW